MPSIAYVIVDHAQ